MSDPGATSSRDYRVVLWVVATVAAAVRMAAAVALDGLRQPQVVEYDVIARNMLAGHGFSYQHIGGVVYYSLIAPLPAWTSAASYWLSRSLAPAMLLQIAAGTALPVVTAAVARRLFGGWMAPFAAGLLTALHPGLVLYSAAKMHALAFDALFFTLALLQTVRLAESVTMRRAVELGLIIGLGILSRATIIIFFSIAGLWLLTVTRRPAWPSVIRGIAIAGVCATAIVGPWTIRNTMLHGRFVFLVTTSSEVFWRGNNPYATGSSYIDGEHTVLQALPADEMRDLQQQPDELAQARWFETRARAFIQAEPVAFMRLTAKKFFYFWWFSPQTGVHYPRGWFQIFLAYYLFALVSAAAGVWRIVGGSGEGNRIAQVFLIAAFLFALSALQSFYYVEGRHRWAVEPMILALSGGGVAALIGRQRLAPLTS